MSRQPSVSFLRKLYALAISCFFHVYINKILSDALFSYKEWDSSQLPPGRAELVRLPSRRKRRMCGLGGRSKARRAANRPVLAGCTSRLSLVVLLNSGDYMNALVTILFIE